MPVSSSMGTAIFPGMGIATGYYYLIQVALPIDEDRRGAVLECCVWMTKRGVCKEKLFGFSKGMERSYSVIIVK